MERVNICFSVVRISDTLSEIHSSVPGTLDTFNNPCLSLSVLFFSSKWNELQVYNSEETSLQDL